MLYKNLATIVTQVVLEKLKDSNFRYLSVIDVLAKVSRPL